MYAIQMTFLLILFAFVCVFAGRKLNFPGRLLVLATGIILGNMQIDGVRLFPTPEKFAIGIMILASSILVFDVFSRLKYFDVLHDKAATFIIYSIVFNMLVFSLGSFFLGYTLIQGALLGIIISANSVIWYQKDHFLNDEWLISNALMILLVVAVAVPDPVGILISIGMGLLVGLLVFRLLHYSWHDKLSPYALLLTVIATYSVTHLIGGSGIIAVASLAFLFGKVTIHSRKRLEEFSTSISEFIELLLFITLGTVIPFSLDALFTGVLLYAAYLLIRYFLLRDLGLTFNSPKGAMIGVALLYLHFIGPAVFASITPIILSIMLISMTVSTVAR